jgi:small subunit ribosomal protein S5
MSRRRSLDKMAEKEEKKEEAPKEKTPEEAPKEEVKETITEDVKHPEDAKESSEVKQEKKGYDTGPWKPVTRLGRLVKAGEITNLDEVLSSGEKIGETEIVDMLVPDLETDLLLIGQAKGKFGGGQRRVFRQTQKKTREGNKPKFSTIAVVGNKNGYVGIGFGKSKETVPAREKSIRNAKLNIFKVKRGCGSWECACGGPHTIPFKVTGKCGSVELTIKSAPLGKGLIAEDECKKIFKMAGINDIWSKSKGQTKTKLNMVYACVDALKKLSTMKISGSKEKEIGIMSGQIKAK